MIGKLLGHTQVQTTHRYAHLFDEPLRPGLDRLANLFETRRQPAEVKTNA